MDKLLGLLVLLLVAGRRGSAPPGSSGGDGGGRDDAPPLPTTPPTSLPLDRLRLLYPGASSRELRVMDAASVERWWNAARSRMHDIGRAVGEAMYNSAAAGFGGAPGAIVRPGRFVHTTNLRYRQDLALGLRRVLLAEFVGTQDTERSMWRQRYESLRDEVCGPRTVNRGACYLDFDHAFSSVSKLLDATTWDIDRAYPPPPPPSPAWASSYFPIGLRPGGSLDRHRQPFRWYLPNPLIVYRYALLRRLVELLARDFTFLTEVASAEEFDALWSGVTRDADRLADAVFDQAGRVAGAGLTTLEAALADALLREWRRHVLFNPPDEPGFLDRLADAAWDLLSDPRAWVRVGVAIATWNPGAVAIAIDWDVLITRASDAASDELQARALASLGEMGVHVDEHAVTWRGSGSALTLTDTGDVLFMLDEPGAPVVSVTRGGAVNVDGLVVVEAA